MKTLENEIAEQAELLGRFGEGDIAQIEKVAKIIDDVNTSGGRVFLFASGSSLNACMYARELFSRDNDIVLEVFPAGEGKNHANDIKQDDLVILVSQSGESGDILQVKNQISKLKIKEIVITNNVGSTLAKDFDMVLNLKAGEEKAVPATKTYFVTLLIFTMLSEALVGRIQITEYRNQISKELNGLTEELKNLRIDELVDKKIFILGSGLAWPQAGEAELKLKEIAKANAEAYELSEFMHGSIEMLDAKSIVIIFCPKLCNELDNKIISNIKSKKSKIIAIGACDCLEADETLKIDEKKYFDLISIVIIQKLAIDFAKAKGLTMKMKKFAQSCEIMCQAIPRKVIKVTKGKAEVETPAGFVEVNLLDDKVKIGDYLLVYGNLGMNRVSKEEAEAILKELKL